MIQLNPTTPVPDKRDIDTLLQLIELLRDPSATKAVLADLAAKKETAEKSLAEAAAWQKQIAADRDRAEREIAEAREKHSTQMREDRQKLADDRAEHAAEVKKREKQIAELHAKASADARSAADLKADLDRRIALINSALT